MLTLTHNEKSRRLDDANYIQRRYILGLAIYREARGETFRGKLLVGNTIKNRVEDRRWPESYTDVILQPWQFSSFNKNDPNNRKFPGGSSISWQQCWEVAGEVLDDDEDPSLGANHYYATWIDPPSWADENKIVVTEGTHVFYKL